MYIIYENVLHCQPLYSLPAAASTAIPPLHRATLFAAVADHHAGDWQTLRKIKWRKNRGTGAKRKKPSLEGKNDSNLPLCFKQFVRQHRTIALLTERLALPGGRRTSLAVSAPLELCGIALKIMNCYRAVALQHVGKGCCTAEKEPSATAFFYGIRYRFEVKSKINPTYCQDRFLPAHAAGGQVW